MEVLEIKMMTHIQENLVMDSVQALSVEVNEK